MASREAINPAQEHFVSNIVRQKIIGSTEELDYQPDSRLSKILLFLPENELHELSLLMYNYALRKRGYPTIYLGQALPLDSLKRILEITNPDLIITLLTNSLNNLDLDKLIVSLSEKFKGKILISGYAFLHHETQHPDNILAFKNFDDLLLKLSNPLKYHFKQYFVVAFIIISICSNRQFGTNFHIPLFIFFPL